MAVQNGRSQPPRRILFLDAYDSFTSNIVSLLRQVLGSHVHVYVRHMDLSPWPTDADRSTWTRETLAAKLRLFDAVVCGPGPGSPVNAKDVGAFEAVWEQADEETMVPVLGICLGFQSLVRYAGGSIRKLKRGLHGMVRDIEFRAADIFTGVRPFKATLYHSLCADDASSASTSTSTPDLLPLAWTRGKTDEGEDDRILMAARHVTKPFWGLQYHPESVCTDGAAQDVLRNWWAEVQVWNRGRGRREGYDAEGDGGEEEEEGGFSFEDTARVSHVDSFERLERGCERVGRSTGFEDVARNRHYVYEKAEIPPSMSAVEIADILKLGNGDSILLDSSSHIKGDPLAKFSIIALDVEHAPRLSHRAGDKHVTLTIPPSPGHQGTEETIGFECAADDEFSPWQAISKFWSDRTGILPTDVSADEPHSTFKGGFMGFVTYESGLATLSPGTVSRNRAHERPDICLAWVTRSIVLDHLDGSVYVQTLSEDSLLGQGWCEGVMEQLLSSSSSTVCTRNGSSPDSAQDLGGHNGTSLKVTKPPTEPYEYFPPGGEKYRSKVRRCQEAISEGNSYELCLTAQTIITRPAPVTSPSAASPWNMFKTLRTRQPAPFGSFIRLGGATLLSSSPERFLKYGPDGVCSMRPMKGTVRKSEAVSTLAQAEAILHVPKEEAENLMIVDLVRHDLHGICGSGRVTVPELLKVEEYATVFQMVTNVQGQLPQSTASPTHERKTDPNGLDVLSSVLPPGSMTGAPKKRSCEILHDLEGGVERSLYSGVVGYMDVTGRGDWSVTIRSTFKWDDETAPSSSAGDEGEGRERWHIGAGGAVTILSTPEGEYDEMRTKLQGPLSLFKEMEQL